MGRRCEKARDSRLIEPTGSGQLSPILEKPGAARLLVAGGRIGLEHTAGCPDRYTHQSLRISSASLHFPTGFRVFGEGHRISQFGPQ